MPEPSRSSSRRALAAGLLAAAACAAGGFALGRSTAPTPPPPLAVSPVPIPSPSPSPAATPAPSVLHRGDLLETVRAVIDSFAAGGPPSPQLLTLEGRRFELRIPFGCHGPLAPHEEGTGWRYDAKTQTLRVSVEPTRWTASDWAPPDSVQDVERVEGFWIERPWTSSETCPPGDTGSDEAAAATERTLALATFATTTDSRIGPSAGTTLSAVATIAPEVLAATRGLRLRISGRIASAPDGGPVVCRQSSHHARPTCLVAITPDSISVELGNGEETLATWDLSPSIGDSDGSAGQR